MILTGINVRTFLIKYINHFRKEYANIIPRPSLQTNDYFADFADYFAYSGYKTRYLEKATILHHAQLVV